MIIALGEVKKGDKGPYMLRLDLIRRHATSMVWSTRHLDWVYGSSRMLGPDPWWRCGRGQEKKGSMVRNRSRCALIARPPATRSLGNIKAPGRLGQTCHPEDCGDRFESKSRWRDVHPQELAVLTDFVCSSQSRTHIL